MKGRGEEGEEEGERSAAGAGLIDKRGPSKGTGRAAKPGPRGRRALPTRGACATNRPVCFHSFAGNLRGAARRSPQSPRARGRPRQQRPPLRRQPPRREEHGARSCAPRPAAPVPAGGGEGILFETPGEAGARTRRKGTGVRPGEPGRPGQRLRRTQETRLPAPQPESAPGRGVTPTPGNPSIKKGLRASEFPLSRWSHVA